MLDKIQLWMQTGDNGTITLLAIVWVAALVYVVLYCHQQTKIK